MDFGIKLKTSGGRVLKYYQLMVIEPSKSLGSALDFSREALDMRYAHGIEQAERFLQGMATEEA